MKKRIFIAIHYLEIGGAERSLIGLLNALDYTKYAVDLFVYQHRGVFMSLIPKQVNLLPEIGSYAAIEKPLKEAIKEGYLGVALGRMLARWKGKRFTKNHRGKESIAVFQYIHSYVVPFLPSLYKYGEYDLAISFLIPHNIVRDKVKAKQKWAWIHTDYSFLEMDTKVELPVWSAYDKIVSISEDVTKGFLTKFPSLKNKILLMENILSEQFVREQANSSLEFRVPSLEQNTLNPKPLTLNLLSVGRYSYPKAFDRAVHICKQINDQLSILHSQLKVRWYIVGFGGEEAKIRKAIEETGMEEHFILLGKKLNPYPYIKACDVYVQPSRYEGKSVTVREAQILCKPVVITNYATAPSQVQDGIDGIIVPNDVEGAAAGIAAFLQDKQKQEQIVSYLQTHHYGNENEVKKLAELI
ncbi:MAG: glycosyltransferase [Bacteroidales bacterium]|nr:glycosyltransferase [Bacteroidales bacterium]